MGGVLYVMLHMLKKQYAMSLVRVLPSIRIHVSQSTAWFESDSNPSCRTSRANWLWRERASCKIAFAPQSPTENSSSRAWIVSRRDCGVFGELPKYQYLQVNWKASEGHG
jgi:hypothetical protein